MVNQSQICHTYCMTAATGIALMECIVLLQWLWFLLMLLILMYNRFYIGLTVSIIYTQWRFYSCQVTQAGDTHTAHAVSLWVEKNLVCPPNHLALHVCYSKYNGLYSCNHHSCSTRKGGCSGVLCTTFKDMNTCWKNWWSVLLVLEWLQMSIEVVRLLPVQ